MASYQDTLDLTAPEMVVTRFLRALETQDHDAVEALLAPDLHYTNVSLPTLKGGKQVARLLRRTLGKGTSFGVQMHHLAVNGDTVLTERTDALSIGPLHMAFWVCGTFQVRDGRIVVWRDYFDWLAVAKGVARGVIGIALPGVRATLPQ